jgi:RND family efflux transporter MFP subunit
MGIGNTVLITLRLMARFVLITLRVMPSVVLITLRVMPSLTRSVRSTGFGVLLVAGAAVAAAPPPVDIPSMLIKLVEQVDVPARETGLLAAVNASEGQIVAAGALLAQIDDTEARLAAERAQIELAVARRNAANNISVRFAKKSVEVAKAELQRSLESVKKYPKSVSDSELDRLRLLVEKGSLEVEQAEHEFSVAAFTQQIRANDCEAAQAKVNRHRIVAPISGVVVQVHRRLGEWVKPGETVLRILRLDRLRAEGFLKAADVSPDLQGRSVKLIVALPNAPAAEFAGKIIFLDPEIDPVNAQVRVWVEVQNEGLRLRPGMRAKMTLIPNP